MSSYLTWWDRGVKIINVKTSRLIPRNHLVPVTKFRKAGAHVRSMRAVRRDEQRTNEIEEQ